MKLVYILTLIGTFFFALSAIIAGSKKKFDLFGLTFIAFVSSLGGGTIRDLLIGARPIAWVKDGNYAISIVLAVLTCLILKRRILKIKRILFITDTVGVAVFTILGLQKSLECGVSPTVSVIFGVISAIMGGVLRDTFCNEVPLIFKRQIYATSCLAGGLVYVLLISLGIPLWLTFTVSVILILALRFLALKFRLSLPKLVVE